MNLTIVHFLWGKLEAGIGREKYEFERLSAWSSPFKKVHGDHSEVAVIKTEHLDPLSLGTSETPDLPIMPLTIHRCLVWKKKKSHPSHSCTLLKNISLTVAAAESGLNSHPWLLWWRHITQACTKKKRSWHRPRLEAGLVMARRLIFIQLIHTLYISMCISILTAYACLKYLIMCYEEFK